MKPAIPDKHGRNEPASQVTERPDAPGPVLQAPNETASRPEGVTEEMVEAADVVWRYAREMNPDGDIRSGLSTALAAVVPMIRAEEREQAARIADAEAERNRKLRDEVIIGESRYAPMTRRGHDTAYHTAVRLAAAIRKGS